MLKPLEYSRIICCIIHIAHCKRIAGQGLGNTYTRDIDNDLNSEPADLGGPSANVFNEAHIHFKGERRKSPIGQTLAEGDYSHKQYAGSNGPVAHRGDLLGKAVYSSLRHAKAPQDGNSSQPPNESGANVSSIHTPSNSYPEALPGVQYKTLFSNPNNPWVARHMKSLHRTGSFASVEPLHLGRRSPRQCPKLKVRTGVSFTCSEGRASGSTCTLKCRNGFVLSGRRTRRCKPRKHRKAKRRADPHWTGKKDDSQCLPVCKHLGIPENGEKTCELTTTTEGKVRKCTIKCNRGFKIVGTAVNFCRTNRQWSSPPATCVAISTIRQARRRRFEFQEHQALPCGESYGLTSFNHEGVVHLVVGDKRHGLVKIFKWTEGKFEETPYQTIQYPSPTAVEVVTSRDGTIWLIIGGEGPSTMYRMSREGAFERSHTTQIRVGSGAQAATDAIAFAELRGEFYRCYGRNRRDTPVIVVHKLLRRHEAGGEIFKRIMRKKLPGERVKQCSMFTEGDSLYAVATLHKLSGRGRLIIGQISKKRMKIVGVVSSKNLYQITDSRGFSIDGERYIAVSQSLRDGQCLIYKRNWRNKPPEEAG